MNYLLYLVVNFCILTKVNVTSFIAFGVILILCFEKIGGVLEQLVHKYNIWSGSLASFNFICYSSLIPN